MAMLDGLGKRGADRALGHRNFRIYFCGLMVSVSGTWMQTTAQAWLVLRLTDSPLALATVASLQFLPIMVLTLVGGAVADRFSRRRLLFVSQSLAAAQALVLGTLVATGTVTIWHVYGLAFTLGLINALDMPLRQSFVGELVPTDVLPNPIALNSMAQNLGRILGPALGGLTIALAGEAAAFYANAATFAGTLIALSLIDPRSLYRVVSKSKANVLGQVGQAVGFAWTQPTVMVLLIGTAFTGMFGQNFTTMIPLAAQYLVKADAAEFGLLNASLGTGSMLGAFLLSSRGPPSMTRILIAGCVFGLALMAVSRSQHLWLSCLLFGLVGSAYVTYTASVSTSMQMQAPPDMRGRFASMIHLLGAGSSPIGQFLTGAVADGFGVGAAIALNGFMCLVGMTLAAAYVWKARRLGTVFLMGRPLAGREGPVEAPAGPLRTG